MVRGPGTGRSLSCCCGCGGRPSQTPTPSLASRRSSPLRSLSYCFYTLCVNPGTAFHCSDLILTHGVSLYFSVKVLAQDYRETTLVTILIHPVPTHPETPCIHTSCDTLSPHILRHPVPTQAVMDGSPTRQDHQVFPGSAHHG